MPDLVTQRRMVFLTRHRVTLQDMIDQGSSFEACEAFIDKLLIPDEGKAALWLWLWANQPRAMAAVS